MQKSRSIFSNGIISGFTKIFEILVPLIIYPYIFRTLGPESYGKVAFANSFVSYFTLFANLGIFAYAQRECSVVRDNPERLNKKLSQIFTFSLLLTSISLIAYFICILFIPSIRTNYRLFLMYSVSIVNASLIMDWIYKVFERFDLVSYRTILAKVVYLILCLLVVKSSKDYFWYAAIYILTASVIQTVINQYGILSGKVGVKLSLCKVQKVKPCFKPIFYLGMVTLGSQLFSSSDVLLTRWIIGGESEKMVGLYTSAILLPETIEGVLMAVAAVVSPQLYISIGKSDESRTVSLMNKTSNAMFMVVVPAVLTFWFFSKEIVSIVAGPEFVDSAPVVRIYSCVLLTAFAITLAGTRTYIARGKEKKLFLILICCAMLNIFLDIILIRRFGITGGAIATVIANVILMSVELTMEKTWHYIFSFDKIKYLIGGILVLIVFVIVKKFVLTNDFVKLFLAIVVGGLFYVVALFALKEDTIKLFYSKIH